MNHCRDCKHWGKTERAEYRACELAGSADGFPESEMWKPPRMAQAFAIDSSHYGAKFITLPDFGCVLWEAKE